MMIQYTLKCGEGHSFDSWFKSSDAFDTLLDAGHLACMVCGSDQVSKAIMAPSVAKGRAIAVGDTPSAPAASTAPSAAGSAMMSPKDQAMHKAVMEIKKQVEANSDYVGTSFAQEARAMHLGEAPERAIYGEANAAQAKSLIEDGVPVLPLPFKPTKQTN